MANNTITFPTPASLTKLDIVMGYMYFVLTATMSILSIIGCSVLILSYFVVKHYRTKARTILVFLSVADLLTATGNIIGISWALTMDQQPFWLCVLHSAMTVYSSICSFLWSVVMAVYLYMVLVKNSPMGLQFTVITHILCWSIPGIVMLTALLLNVLGPDWNAKLPSWCWIRSDTSNIFVWQLLTGKLWEIACYITVAAIYTVIKCHLYKQRRNLAQSMRAQSLRVETEGSKRLKSATLRMTFVPVVFIFCRIWGTLRFLINYFDPNRHSAPYIVWLVALQGIGDSAQGFANCIIYGATSSKIQRNCCGRRKVQSEASDNKLIATTTEEQKQ